MLLFLFWEGWQRKDTSNELKNRNQDVQSDSASFHEQAAPSDCWPGISIIFIQSLEMLHLANAKWAAAKQLDELIPVINYMLSF